MTDIDKFMLIFNFAFRFIFSFAFVAIMGLITGYDLWFLFFTWAAILVFSYLSNPLSRLIVDRYWPNKDKGETK